MAKYKVAVLGPIPRDHVVTHKNEVFDKYGGATHAAIALARLLEDEGEVIPVTHVRKRDQQAILDIFKPYANIDSSYVNSEADQGDVINLTFVTQNRRLEKQVAFMDPIVPADLEGLMDCDAFVFVPVTDFEVPLETLKFIKENSNGVTIFDAHGPTNTLTIKGDRLNKFWVERDIWLPYIDVLKMNLEEAYCSWYEREYTLKELEENEEIDRAQLPNFGRHCVDHGVKALFVTVDSDGVMGYWEENGEFKEELIPSIKVESVVQTTGCGDSFAGGLAYGLLKDQSNYVKAAQYGNAMGAQRTQGKTFEVFKSREQTKQIISNGKL